MTERKNIICPFCGCLCDDVYVEVKDNVIKQVFNGCKLCKAKLSVGERLKKPLIRKDGKLVPTSYEKAVEHAARILMDSKMPLLYGWSSTSCEAISRGVRLAEEVRGVIDNTSSVCHGPSILGLQEVGLPTCTLGEVKNRADLIIYWGCNPIQAHPRHMSRYTLIPRGYFRDDGMLERKLVVVDVRNTDTAGLADQFLKIKPGYDYELLSALRAALRGHEVPDVGGIKSDAIKELSEKMRSAKFSALFFGVGLTMSGARYRNIENAIALTRDLNEYTRSIIMPMRGHYNVDGFNQILTWQTGYPFGVDFSRGYPRYNPGEFCANDLLVSNSADSALIIASDPAAHFPKESLEVLKRIPLITIDPFKSLTSLISDVVIPSAITGIESEGTAYRMDSVPITLRKVVDSGYKSDKEIINDILNKVMTLKHGSKV
ncbi:MAG: formylmethanofuran dehydrogenase subunit B [Candidatus Altiarchaeota archaeon]|nr:formylmethanofuran dehydrogenase subunit B [Candidatus Altiarchaeota archaeon]